jgi:hypothetical protein
MNVMGEEFSEKTIPNAACDCPEGDFGKRSQRADVRNPLRMATKLA